LLVATTNSPLGKRSSACTGPGGAATADHAAPFQRARPPAATPPIVVKEPPATRSPFGSTSSARTGPSSAPSDDQAAPSQRDNDGKAPGSVGIVCAAAAATTSPFGSSTRSRIVVVGPLPSGAQLPACRRHTVE
jgi:hypothetical protein